MTTLKLITDDSVAYIAINSITGIILTKSYYNEITIISGGNEFTGDLNTANRKELNKHFPDYKTKGFKLHPTYQPSSKKRKVRGEKYVPDEND